MNIRVNGEPREVPEDLSLSGLIALLDLGSQRIAVEINEELVPRSRFAEHRLSPGDQVEIIHAVGGG